MIQKVYGKIVGILNCTPDSFFEKGRHLNSQEAIAYGLSLFEEGAEVVDIGGESTRPGSNAIISSEKEINRVLPVIKGIRKQSHQTLSIDTFKPEVAKVALEAGVNWINDITGFSNPEMRKIARESGAKCVVMHMPGPPHTTPSFQYKGGVVCDITTFFKKRVQEMLDDGISPTQIILDPGIGGGSFGKNVEQNLLILNNLKSFLNLGFPLLIGLSRKLFIQTILEKPPSEVLSTTLVLNTMALLEGAAYIRVHDVAAHKDILTVLGRLGSCQ